MHISKLEIAQSILEKINAFSINSFKSDITLYFDNIERVQFVLIKFQNRNFPASGAAPLSLPFSALSSLRGELPYSDASSVLWP